MNKETVLVIDFGGQYNQLIARRVRECNVYCEVVPFEKAEEAIQKNSYKAIILTGGPASVYEEGAPRCSKSIFTSGIPVLGICYGAQLMAQTMGGLVDKAGLREYGNAELSLSPSLLFKDIPEKTSCWMSHTDYIKELPEGFTVIATTPSCPCAAMENPELGLYAVQFHPEVVNTPEGTKVIRNFLFEVAKVAGDWQMDAFAADMIAAIKEKVGDEKAICALSGGVDSSVAAVMMHKAIGKQLYCIFVDHGLLRKNEGEQVEEVFRKTFDMNLIKVDAKERFLNRLAGVTDPETKRKIIGEEFIRVFEEEAQKLGDVKFLVQGTIYPDVIESGAGKAATIKSHHNVGGLPDNVSFKEIIEPLRNLFKDEVRKLGIELGIPENLVWRQPFPGPGLGVRIIGDITAEKLEILKDADAIFREEIAEAGLDKEINQYFAVLTNMKSVGVMGDGRTYDYTVALRAVITSDFMTADWAHIPFPVLAKTSSRIVNEVKKVNRVVYDITSKPPATIEWE
ncbi:MAG: glutamine-hydrolyzing GMP synthase [Alphaproteobacteria bacterium]|nr:glutamine-hydrolyzing GMP synthase [Alphaproteobacteria bacterium]